VSNCRAPGEQFSWKGIEMGNTIRVLYASENQIDRERVRDLLEKEHGGFKIIGADSRETLEARIMEGGFDVLLTDLNIFGFEGIQIVNHIRSRSPSLPVVIVTGSDFEPMAVKAMNQGADDYVIKSPKHFQRLPQSIEGVLKKKRLEERLRFCEDQLRFLAAEVSLAEEKERRAIAVNLHDRLGQTLALAKTKLKQIKEEIKQDQLMHALEEIEEMLDQAIQTMRSLAFDLSPPVLYELGLGAALKWLGERVEEQGGIQVEVAEDEEPKPLGEDVRILLFQGVKELLGNVVKHAQARHAKVSLHRAGEKIRVTVEDDGVGFEIPPVSGVGKIAGFGLANLRERLAYLNGGLEIESKPGHGTRAAMVVPLQREGRTEKS
jgi:signal transduction histidine kinase